MAKKISTRRTPYPKPTHTHTGLQDIRANREQAQSDVEALEREKRAIQNLLPKVLYELNQLRDSLEHKERELSVLDKAIEEIEASYGHMIFSAEFYSGAEGGGLLKG
jgi:chromosome segregation ATPase